VKSADALPLAPAGGCAAFPGVLGRNQHGQRVTHPTAVARHSVFAWSAYFAVQRLWLVAWEIAAPDQVEGRLASLPTMPQWCEISLDGRPGSCMICEERMRDEGDHDEMANHASQRWARRDRFRRGRPPCLPISFEGMGRRAIRDRATRAASVRNRTDRGTSIRIREPGNHGGLPLPVAVRGSNRPESWLGGGNPFMPNEPNFGRFGTGMRVAMENKAKTKPISAVLGQE